MNKATNAGRRTLSLVLTAALLLGMALYLPGPAAVHAENGCNHVHKGNDAEGGREGPLGGNEDCGYVAGAPCQHVHDEDCGEDGADCPHVHDGDCGYIDAVPCAHVHDEDCGGLADADNGGGSTQTPPLVSRASATVIILDDVTGTETFPEWNANGATQTITLTGAGPFTLKGATDYRVVVDAAGPVAVTLSGVDIDASNIAAFTCDSGSSVTLTLEGSNTLKGYPGIDNRSGNPLAITGDTVNVIGQGIAPTIGISGDITVSGGTVNTSSSSTSTGNGISGNVTVSGGTVNATGSGGIQGNVTVSGGTVNATGSAFGIFGNVLFEGPGAVNVTSEDPHSFAVETTISSFIWSVSGAGVTTNPGNLTGVDSFTLDHPGGGQQVSISLSVPAGRTIDFDGPLHGGDGWFVSSGVVVRLTDAGPFLITGATTDHRVVVDTTGPVAVTLSDVDIDAGNVDNAFTCQSGSVTLTLVDNNKFKGSNGIANYSGNPLVITGGGTLNATGGASIANNGIMGAVTVSGGATVNATSSGGIQGNVTVSGGTVNATGSAFGISGNVLFEGPGAVNVTSAVSHSFTVETTISSFIWSVSGAGVTTNPGNLTGVDSFTLDHPGGGQQVSISLSVPSPPATGAHTVTFDPNGGAVSTGALRTGRDGKLTALPTPTREGYSFDGWYTAAEGGRPVTTDTVFTGDTTVYAHWTQTGGGSSSGASPGGSSGRGGSGGGASNPAAKSIAGVEQLDGYRFRVDLPVLGFLGASVDGAALARGADYTIREGSTVLTLSDSYLRTLQPGAHTLRMEFVAATATADFTVDSSIHTANTGGGESSGGNATQNPNTGMDPALLPLLRYDPGLGLLRAGAIALAVLLASLFLWAAVPRKTDDAGR